MKDAEIADRLRQRNHWWREPNGWEERDESLREAARAPFDYRPEVLSDIESGGLYTLSGPRRVGKSVELRRGIAALIAQGESARNIVFCSCDDFSAQDLRRLFRVGESLTRNVDGPRWWFIDEITAVGRGWPGIVKDLRDGTPLRRDCVVLTGSSSRELREATKSLAGRRGPAAGRSDLLLLPMAFRDFCKLVGGLADLPPVAPIAPQEMMGAAARRAIGELSFWTNELVDAWELYLRVGGFPRAITDFLHTGGVTSAFSQDLWDVIRGEAIRATSLGDADLLGLLARLVQGMCSPLNATGLAHDVGLGSHHSVHDRLNDLAFAFQAFSCHRSGPEGLPNVRAQRKVYFLDPLIAFIPAERNRAHRPPDPSRLSEQQLGLSLLRSLARGRADVFLAFDQVMYERTANSEIDFVGPAIGVPFESKYVEGGWKRGARVLATRYGRGIVATRNVLDTDGPVWAVPAGLVGWLMPTGQMPI